MPSPGTAAPALRLTRHPASPGAPDIAIEVSVTRSDAGVVTLTYAVTGQIGEVVVPAPVRPAQKDELWRRTCFEAFLRPPAGEAYVELNLSPSGAWAAYGFASYRRDMTVLDGVRGPRIDFGKTAQRLELSALWDLGGVAQLPRQANWRIGLSAVIEDSRGRISYWALAHPAAKPDFHHQASFVHPLAPSEGS